jgi:hypothetical protein
MWLVKKGRVSGRCILAALQACALAVFLFGVGPQPSLAFANNAPKQKLTLIRPADYLEAVSISQGTKALDGCKSANALATDNFNAGETNHASLLKRSNVQLVHRSATFRSSLIRSPPIESPLSRL